MYSGKKVVKAGEKLLDEKLSENKDEFDSVMEVLSYWRFSHEVPLDRALLLLEEISLEKDKSAIFAKRLKRTDSIVKKLKRFNKMKLKNMQDIGGCRVIVSDQKKADKISRDLRKEPNFKGSDGKVRAKDYIKNPKDDGYRGYHLIGVFEGSNEEKRNIEIQIRTKLQHDWATALEIVDLFTGQSLKSNEGDEDWKKFFQKVSEQFSLMEKIHVFDKLSEEDKLKKYIDRLTLEEKYLNSCIDAQRYEKRLRVYKKLEVFAKSIKIIDEDHLQKFGFDGYVLLEVDTEKAIVNFFLFTKEDGERAEKKYLELEKSSAGIEDKVIALVSTTSVGGIKEAYPNYFADSSEFLKHLNFIMKVPKENRESLLYGLFDIIRRYNLPS